MRIQNRNTRKCRDRYKKNMKIQNKSMNNSRKVQDNA